MPFYVVGNATATALKGVGDDLGDTPFTPKKILGGSESGTAERLAHFIVENLEHERRSKKLLYLVGDKNRETLANIVEKAELKLEAIHVYETCGSTTFDSDLGEALGKVPRGTESLVRTGC